MQALIAQYLRQLRDYRRSGKVSDVGSHWRELFAATNGASNDLGALLLRRTRTRYGDTDGVLGPLRAAARRKIVKAIRRDGYCIFPGIVPARILDAIEADALRRPAITSPKFSREEMTVYDPANQKAATYWWGRDLMSLPELQELMVDETFTAIATDYIRADPILNSAQPWLSVRYGNGPSSESAQLFHYDLDHLRWLKIYVYLRDVTAQNGPHTMVRGTHRTFDLKGRTLRRRGQIRLSDEDVVATYGADRIVEVTGCRGTVFAVDTRAFHKGKPVFEGERMMLELYYVNSDFGGFTWAAEPIANPTPKYRAAARRWPRLLSHFPVGE